MSDPRQEKARLRARIQSEITKIPATERAALSRLACERLREHALWRKAGKILFYVPLPDELDLWPMLIKSLEGGKIVALPRFDSAHNRYVPCRVEDVSRDLQIGRFGIREPGPACPEIPLAHLDLILAPGVAYDLGGHRLGRGGGFYDRLLAEFHGATCGVGFEQQLVSHIPVEPHDIVLKCILTPARWHDVAGPRPALK
jgi:5-formyltetrahydrofolate cyclo-ligase